MTHPGDVGTRFLVNIVDDFGRVVDISEAQTKTLIFKKPGGSVIERDAEWGSDNNGSDGLLKYYSVDGDIDEVGTWKIQAKVIEPDGAWKSSFKSFKVHRNL
jgi:hypothetical protein